VGWQIERKPLEWILLLTCTFTVSDTDLQVGPPFTYDILVLGLRSTHNLSTIGLSALAICRAYNTTSRIETQTTEARDQCVRCFESRPDK
jgi:hypothetical protein